MCIYTYMYYSREYTVHMHIICTLYNDKPLESLTLIRQKVFDVGTSCEDPLQVDPPPLNVNPHVKESVDSVESVLPGHGVIFKHLEVG